MKLRVKGRTQPGWLSWVLVVLPFLAFWLPEGTKYGMDLAWMALVVYLVKFRRELDWGKLGGLPGWVLAFGWMTFAVYLVRYQSAGYYLWGLRNNFRFYAAFFAFALCLTREDIAEFWRILEGLFWADIGISLVQFYGFGLKGDYLGGLFGWEQGCNGYTNLFFVAVVTKSLVSYLEKEEGAGSCGAKCAATLYVAALAELKFFFVEFVAIILLAVLLTNFTWRKLGVILFGCAAAALCGALLYALFPEFAGWFSWPEMLRTASSEEGYASAGDLNRLTAVSGINRRVFQGWQDRMFGLGLGNCDYSGFDALTTPFYRAYAHLHYTWMSVAFVYLETGYLGLLFFFGFFLLVFFRTGKLARRGGDRSSCCTARIMAVMCLLIGVYNASLRTEAGYLAYFTLALPFASDRRKP